METSVSTKKALKAALRGGLFASGINLIWYFVLEFSLGLSGLPAGFQVAIVISTILPLLLGAVVYALLVKHFLKGQMLYLILAIAFAAFSVFPSFEPVLADGTPTPQNFALLTLPMHGVAAFFGTYFLIRYSK